MSRIGAMGIIPRFELLLGTLARSVLGSDIEE